MRLPDLRELKANTRIIPNANVSVTFLSGVSVCLYFQNFIDIAFKLFAKFKNLFSSNFSIEKLL